MRLNFSTKKHLNTDISDERGNVYYTVSTSNKVTTITKYRWSDASPSSAADSETVGTIEWHWLRSTVMKFDGKALDVDDVMQKRSWETGRYFVGPDRKTYKWKMESTHCWMKAADTTAELVRFHQKNMGIRKPPHPAYLDISPKVVPILDHVILTFVYVEWLRQERSKRQHAGAVGAATASNAAAMGGVAAASC